VSEEASGQTDPQARSWGNLEWSPWVSFAEAVGTAMIPATPGLYRFRARGVPGLLYIGESGARKGRRSRLRALARGMRRRPASHYLDWRAAGLPRRPHRGHFAAPHLRRCQDAGCDIQVSWSQAEFPDKTARRQKEHDLIVEHRRITSAAPPVQHGGAGMADLLARLQDLA
jgi:hypothetical protein